MDKKKTRKEIFEDYDGFVEKFKPKKTTDDCMTPPSVYEAILRWVDANIIKIDSEVVVRPFWPGGDYVNFDYPEGCIVVDNPPFSMLAKIRKFYNERGIRYFLFAPQLTLFSAPHENDTYIVACAEIEYENGARVLTGFVTNILKGEPRVMVRGDIHRLIAALPISKIVKTVKPKSYPIHLISAALLGRLAKRGLCLSFSKSDSYFVRKLDNQSSGSIFGGGFLISERAAAERVVAEQTAAERIELSEREWEIVRSLGSSNLPEP